PQQPIHIIREWPGWRQLYCLAGGKSREESDHLFDKHHSRPAINEAVMNTKNEMVRAVRNSQQRQPQQRRRGEIEASLPVFEQECLHALGSFFSRKAPQVMEF